MDARGRVRRILWLLGTMVALGACGAAPPEPVTLRMAVLTTESYLPYFVMREQGIAGRLGIRFEEVQASSGFPMVQAMAAGKADVGFASTVAMLAGLERGLVPEQVVAIAAGDIVDRQHPGGAVVVPYWVGSWRDLEGKYLGVPNRTSILGVAAMARLRAEGVRDVRPIEIPFANMGLAVASGHVSAGVMLEPYLSQSLARGDGKLLDWVLGGPPLEEVLFAQLVVRTETLRARPEAVRRLLRAYVRTARWIGEHPAEARAVLVSALAVDPGIAQRIRMRRWQPELRSDPRLIGPLRDLLLRDGLLKTERPLERLFDEGLLSAVLAEGS